MKRKLDFAQKTPEYGQSGHIEAENLSPNDQLAALEKDSTFAPTGIKCLVDAVCQGKTLETSNRWSAI